jgi:cysteine desulfurase
MTMPDLDANATTPLHPLAGEAMAEAAAVGGNPASPHRIGRRARQLLDDARERIAARLDAQPGEIIFTSGATEANNLAIAGLAGALPGPIVVSAVEHPCVVEPVAWLQKQGWSVARIMPDADGFIGAIPVRQAITSQTRFAAIMLANHETGAINDVAAMTGLVPVHTDAAQAVGKIPVSFAQLGVATLSLSAHKFRGPVGIGVLIVRQGTKLGPLIRGGTQQEGRRAGTEPVPLVVGMAAALEQAVKGLAAERERQARMRRRLAMALADLAVINGPGIDHPQVLPGTLNLSFPGCRSDLLLMKLDLAGISASTGAACASGAMLPSPVLAAMGITGERLRSAVRFSWSSATADDEFDAAIPLVRECVLACKNQ